MHRRKETADVIFDFFRRKEHHRRPVASPTTPLLCTKRGKTLSDHVFRDPKGNTLCISCLPEHLQESAYRYAESLDTLAAGPEREAGDGSPLRSAICSASQTPKISAQIVYTGGRAPSNRRRQTLAATTSMTTSTGLATGFGKSPYFKTSGPTILFNKSSLRRVLASAVRGGWVDFHTARSPNGTPSLRSGNDRILKVSATEHL